MEKREEGYYWVRNSDCEWYIAEYIGGYWQYPNTLLGVSEQELRDIGPRIMPPNL